MCIWGFLSIKKKFILTQVSLYFWEKTFLVGPRRKHQGLTIYFPFSPPNQTHLKKFSFIFSLQSFLSSLFHLQTNTPL